MKTFFITFFSFLLTIIAFNLYVDKNFFWHRQVAFENFKLEKGECLKFAGEKLSGTDRLAHRFLRKHMPIPDTVIFSSSRGAYADQEMFKNKIIYNSASSISLLEDYVDVWMDLKAQQKIPSEVIIFFDPWIFNQNISNFRSWDSLTGLGKFLNENSNNVSYPNSQKKYYLKQKIERWRIAILNLISFEQTLNSWDVFAHTDYKNLEIKKCSDINDELTYLSYSGAHISKKYPTPLELHHIVSAKDSGLSYIDPWQKNPFLVEVFDAFLSDMLSRNVKIHIVAPLTHPVSFTHASMTPAMIDYRDSLNKFQQDPRLNVCNAIDLNPIPCEKNEFKDAIHMTRSCTEKLLKYCQIL